MTAREERCGVLLAIAREAISAPPEASAPSRWPVPWLQERAASFVTLKLDGELRGCIGSIEAHRALGEDVHANARAAAYRDPRFPPVARHEIAALAVEVSVLSARESMDVASERDALAALRPGIDGVVLEYDGRRATFLPQVWEGLGDPLDFLTQLRLKAQLPARFWHPQLRLSRYTVEKYR
jgi:hypothetical protein